MDDNAAAASKEFQVYQDLVGYIHYEGKHDWPDAMKLARKVWDTCEDRTLEALKATYTLLTQESY